MKLYAPTYYQNFKCIADRCEHSCCIGWEIDVDERTAEAYKTLEHPYGAVIRESISTDGTPHFKLCEHDRCPHLDERGLCKIILNVGEDSLCDICREHPRFYNFTTVAEVGIGMSCPEAARVILSSPHYGLMEEVGEVDATEDEIEFDGLAERGRVYDLLQIEGDYTARLASLYRAYGIAPLEDSVWLEKLSSLEYLNPDHRALFLHYSALRRPFGMDAFLERALAYFVYRHCTEAFDADDFCARLSFCLFCERLLASLICHQQADSLQEIATLASILSEEIEYSDINTEVLMY